MLLFEYVLILLAAVMLSNLINRFAPVLSAPILQIILGVLIALIPFGVFGFELELEPELFFVLFIAPLIFQTSMTADKKTLWELKWPIIGCAVALVIITSLVVGYSLHAIIPAIPLAATFALIGALSPTDDVAVGAVRHRATVPHKIMNILSGESIINDASGIVCFHFALVAAITGSFSITKAVGQFFFVGIGGILAGLVFTLMKYGLVKWLRLFGIENVSLHILIGLLTPFIIFMAAEGLGVSGILAVFASGISHSFARDKLNPETVNLKISLKSIWLVISFTFEGMVFVILGTQLPDILKTLWRHSISGWRIVGCAFLLTLVFAAFRFTWWVLMVREKSYQEIESPIGKIKSGMIFSLAGARGAVTLACVMSIPLALADGSRFPERDLIILLASCIIVMSLLITNFVLPLFAPRKPEQGKAEAAARAEIIQKVMTQLLSEATEENRQATEIVVRSYFERNAASMAMGNNSRLETDEDKKLRAQALLWEKENTLAMLEKGTIDEADASHFIEVLDAHVNMGKGIKRFFQKIAWFIRHLLRLKRLGGKRGDRNNFVKILTANSRFALERLNEIKNDENASAVDKLISNYELLTAFHTGMGRQRTREKPDDENAAKSILYEVLAKGFQMERGLIHQMFEAGRISRESAKEMRGNIAALQARLQAE